MAAIGLVLVIAALIGTAGNWLVSRRRERAFVSRVVGIMRRSRLRSRIRANARIEKLVAILVQKFNKVVDDAMVGAANSQADLILRKVGGELQQEMTAQTTALTHLVEEKAAALEQLYRARLNRLGEDAGKNASLLERIWFKLVGNKKKGAGEDATVPEGGSR